MFASILLPFNFKLKRDWIIKEDLSSTHNFLLSDLSVHKRNGDLSVSGDLSEASAEITQLPNEVRVA